ncbi:MAG: hypothetical protein HC828_20265 [Blastochloris sp.]|nr:hypothetical protein [Blastochloris sp.]
MLKAYQSIYSADRISRNQTGQKCQAPTDEQLQRMAALLPAPPDSHQLLSDLQALAAQLRQAKIQATEPLDLDRSDQQPALAPAPSSDLFLSSYFREFMDCLDQAIQQTLEQRLLLHRRKKPPPISCFAGAAAVLLRLSKHGRDC